MEYESNSDVQELFPLIFEQNSKIPFQQFNKFQRIDIYKNFPKLIGNSFVKWINKQKEIQGAIGIQKLIKQRKESKQANFKIKDLQELCSDEASKQVFQEFILDEFFLKLIHSNKIEDSFSYVAGISNYYSAAQEPEKMKSNYLTRQLFTDLLNNTH
ncbi:unnamed protein product [Paramecium sonneborni]|uniref:Uncharacterized protein n=1 Tax=Paramecium sonneborni TaxID=65129 RepID=A0A8S1QYC5_9CILI|nr:unnamed protein product [Paramecium sonneborni]